MNLYLYDIGEKARKASRFIGQVRAELQRAFAFEKSHRKITQQQVATMIGTNRSVINRELMGLENLTLRRVAELAWALGWEIVFYLRKPEEVSATTEFVIHAKAEQMPRRLNQEARSDTPALILDKIKSYQTAA
jgi:hypothetical protein